MGSSREIVEGSGKGHDRLEGRGRNRLGRKR
jgi:hypothetical protein